MKSQSWIKKALHIYLFNLVLIMGQLTAIGGSLPAYSADEKVSAESIYPPGFTQDDYKVLAERDRAAEENYARERDRNVGKKTVEQDISSSECRTFAANDTRRMVDITSYRALTGAQGYDEICRLRQKLNSQTGGPAIQCGNSLELIGDSASINREGQLSSAESKYNTSVTDKVEDFDVNSEDSGRVKVEKRYELAKAEVARLRALVPEKRSAYERARNRCQDDGYIYCTRDERNEVERLRNDYQSSVLGLASAEKENKAARKAIEDYGKAVDQQEGQVVAAGSDMAANDEQMKESDALSGVENTATGEGGGLTGPVYETNEALKNAIDKYTTNAATFAQEKIAETARLEFMNQNKGDYEYYEMALQDIDPNTRGGKMALSNLDVTAMASASIKKLECNPKRKHESKAYHIFRAASATYIAAQIGDNSSYNQTMSCLRDEVFNENEKNDEQFESAEKALNSHTQIVDSMCTEVAPDPDNIPQLNGVDVLPRERVVKLKEICDASAGVTCAPGQENGCAPRTRETALEMYTTALMIAQQELGDKRQLVATAEANVEKGKKKIKATLKSIAISIALDILWKVISQTEFYQGLSMNASSPPCFCAGVPLLIKSAWSKLRALFFYGKYIYYGVQLIRWTNFKNKWERKLEEAREHTHLACNYDKAKTLAGTYKSFAEKTKADAIKAHNAAKEKIQNSINKNNFGALGKTSYLMLPKGMNENAKQLMVESFLKKYIKVVGKSAMNMIFPVALAADTHVDSNTDQATDTTLGDTTASAKALGMTMGSSSFYQFVISQNDHWQEQAYDADVHKTESGYVRNDNPIMYCDEGGSGSCIQPEIAGMPTPETRVRLITNTVQLLQDNIGLSLQQLDIGVNQRDQYVMLLNKMRAAMKLKETGIDMQTEEKPVQKASACMKKAINGDYEVDRACQCQQTGNCASLQYSNFGEFSPGVIADGENSVKAYADSSLSGDLKGAKVAAGDLNKNSNAVRRKVRDAFSRMNKLREKSGQAKINYSKAARRAIADRRAKSFEKYKKIFPDEYKFEKVKGGLASFNRDLDMDGAATKSTQPALAASKGKHSTGSGAGVGKGGKGDIAQKKKDEDQFSFDFDEEGEDVHAAKEDAQTLASLDAEAGLGVQDEDYKYERTIHGKRNNNGINKDTEKNIFGIISNRYKKTAFPIFLLGEQSMR